jgi:alpha-glucosidase
LTVSGVIETSAALLAEPHHDGFELYVLQTPDELGGEAVLRLRVPRAAAADGVALRYVRDGEPQFARAQLDAETDDETWWRASFPVTNPVTRYRWLLSGQGGETAVTALGAAPFAVPDADDFVLTLGAAGPAWHLESVVYEIFPDRFAPSGIGAEPPAWAVRRAWDELPTARGRSASREWFGGDLRGIAARLDHVERLGANAIYLTPIFPAGSTHRYDATTFRYVDPLLGGDAALRELADAAHARGIRLIGDLTLNHCGSEHEWFRAARDSRHEKEFFYFDDSLPYGYECWFGVPSLPKLDWRSAELRERMLRVARTWLDDGLDGWRIDVANMVGRLGAIELNQDVARLVRGSLAPEELLVAEHGHDYRPDLDGRGWHGAMNYAGFLRPVWSWLRADVLPDELERSFWGTPFGLRRSNGVDMTATMRAFRAGVPWASTLNSWTLLDSHDSARFRTVSGARGRHLVGIGLQMTTPGVPMVFAGDEVGLEGEWGEDARRTMPWDRRDEWDATLFESYRALIALRRSSDALARGGIRYVHVSPDAIAYLRESPSESLLCLAARAPHQPLRVPFRSLETLYGDDASDGVLPADGPAFHVWRLIDG